jgi:hypothetical protein
MSKQTDFPFGFNVPEVLANGVPEPTPVWDEEDEELLAESMADLDDPNSVLNQEDPEGYGWGV